MAATHTSYTKTENNTNTQRRLMTKNKELQAENKITLILLWMHYLVCLQIIHVV